MSTTSGIRAGMDINTNNNGQDTKYQVSGGGGSP